MLYVFVGLDVARAKSEARKLSKKAEVFVVGAGAEAFSLAPQIALSSGLFSPTTAVIVDRPFDSPEGKELISVYADMLHKSSVPVFIITPTLLATEKKLFPKGAEFQNFDVTQGKEVNRPNVFAFTDSFLSNDRKKAWLHYQKLLSSGISPEEIHGALLWAVRSTLIAGKTQSATEAGLKPFVYTKSKRTAERLGMTYIENMSRELVSVYHRARSGEGTIALGIEHMILEKR